jgi:FtsH ternary system domain X6
VTARVSRVEAVQLRILRAALGRDDAVDVDTALRTSLEVPRALSHDAAALLEDTLRKGLALELVRRGGWRRGRCVHGGEVREGRLWERHTPPPLLLTRATREVLRWLASEPLGRIEHERVALGPLSLGDELVMLFAAELLVRAGCSHALDALSSSRLVRIALAPLLSVARAGEPLVIDEPLEILIEALGPELARTWRVADIARRRAVRPELMISMDAAASAHLDRLLPALGAERAYLACFVTDAALEVLAAHRAPDVATWAPFLDRSGSVSTRAAAIRAASMLPRAALRISALHAAAVATPFFEDGYAAAQLLLSRLAPFRERAQRDAEAVITRLSSLDAAL